MGSSSFSARIATAIRDSAASLPFRAMEECQLSCRCRLPRRVRIQPIAHGSLMFRWTARFPCGSAIVAGAPLSFGLPRWPIRVSKRSRETIQTTSIRCGWVKTFTSSRIGTERSHCLRMTQERKPFPRFSTTMAVSGAPTVPVQWVIAAIPAAITLNTPVAQPVNPTMPRPGTQILKLDDMEVRIDPREWKQMYHEAFRLERDFFYDPGFHGLNLAATEKQYEPYLDGLGARTDLNYLLKRVWAA